MDDSWGSNYFPGWQASDYDYDTDWPSNISWYTRWTSPSCHNANAREKAGDTEVYWRWVKPESEET